MYGNAISSPCCSHRIGQREYAMRIRLITALCLAICVTVSLRAQAPYDPVKEQFGLFIDAGPCGEGASDESSAVCYLFGVLDADGSHQIFFPALDDHPRFSPDGSSVVGSFKDDIVIVSLPSGAVTNLTNSPSTLDLKIGRASCRERV